MIWYYFLKCKPLYHHYACLFLLNLRLCLFIVVIFLCLCLCVLQKSLLKRFRLCSFIVVIFYAFVYVFAKSLCYNAYIRVDFI